MNTIDVARLREVLDYDPDTGIFTWKARTGKKVKIGTVAGYKAPDGYFSIRIDRCLFQAHRLAVAHVEGVSPPNHIDHINGNPSDNRYLNLRHATHAENHQNRIANRSNTSGYIGVHFRKDTEKWVAQIRRDGVGRCLGCFSTPEEAHAAYRAAKAHLHTFNPVPRPR